jgi:hypothetical protein
LVGFIFDLFECNCHLRHQKIHEQNIREEHAGAKECRRLRADGLGCDTSSYTIFENHT